MPMKHKYKCENPGCPGTGRIDDTGLFIALNAPTPQCPCCRSMKVTDWGESSQFDKVGPVRSQNAHNGSPGAGQRIDGTLQRLADAYGLTDINNAGGKAAKGQSAPAKGKYGNFEIAGVSVPIDDKITTVSGSSSYTPFAVPTSKGKLPGARAIPRAMTEVIAEHKG